MDKLSEKIVFNRINSTDNEVTQTVHCTTLQGIMQEVVEAPVEAMATLVLSCAPPLAEDNFVNNLYHCSLVLRKNYNAIEKIF